MYTIADGNLQRKVLAAAYTQRKSFFFPRPCLLFMVLSMVLINLENGVYENNEQKSAGLMITSAFIMDQRCPTVF